MVIPHDDDTVPVIEFPDESVTVAVKVKAPAVVGVPVMAPVLVFRARPGGSAPDAIEKE
jgi:hypothetical protein